MVIEMNKRNEKISAFLDNGMHSDELMSFSLLTEAEDAKVAQRYQMVGDALRGELSDSSFIDVSQAVREALADENIASEMNAESAESHSVKDHQTQSTAQTISGDKSSTGFFDWSSLFRPAAGMATAALVAVVMVFSLSEQGDDFAPNAVAVQQAGSSAANNAVASQTVPVQPASNQQGNQPSNQQQSQFRTVANVQGQPAQVNTLLNAANVNPANVNVDVDNKATTMSPYINQHLEFARQDTLQGRMPYVRAVSFEK